MTSSPLIRMRPDVGSISRLIIRSVVVFPQPDGPIRTTIDPSSMSRLNDDTAGVAEPSNRFETFSRLMATEPIVLPFEEQPTNHCGSGARSMHLPSRDRLCDRPTELRTSVGRASGSSACPTRLFPREAGLPGGLLRICLRQNPQQSGPPCQRSHGRNRTEDTNHHGSEWLRRVDRPATGRPTQHALCKRRLRHHRSHRDDRAHFFAMTRLGGTACSVNPKWR